MTWTYSFTRQPDHERQPCHHRGNDETQPCNTEGGTWLATATAHMQVGTRTKQQILCSNHAARLASEKSVPWPPTKTVEK